jgi:hypothetical protein
MVEAQLPSLKILGHRLKTKIRLHQGQSVKKITVYLGRRMEPHRIGKLERHHRHFLVLVWPLMMMTSSTMSLRKAP